MSNQWSNLTVGQRFLEKTDRSGDCWEWTAGKDKDGYGTFRFQGKKQRAHRVSYMLFLGPLNGLDVLHKCDNPSCVRWSHLFLGTNADNMADRDKKGRVSRGVSHYAAKLNELDVWLIRNLDSSYSKIAKFFDISKGHVANIKKRRKWTHVD